MISTLSLPFPIDQLRQLYIDAGVAGLRLLGRDSFGQELGPLRVPSHWPLKDLAQTLGLDALADSVPIFITGKLQKIVRETFGRGERIDPLAALWAGARALSNRETLAILELSASGYRVVGIDPQGQLKEDMLLVNPRCGAGSGVNLERILQKLAIEPEQVDGLLSDFLGDDGKIRRESLQPRADRCGVFASSATISDKNQGIPLDFALATTLKSEVLKVCSKLAAGFETVWLTGGVFAWRFARECAADCLTPRGVKNIRYDNEGLLPIRGMMALEKTIGAGQFIHPDQRIVAAHPLARRPAFLPLREQLQARHRFRRLSEAEIELCAPDVLANQPLLLGLDVGSTMAKLVVADLEGNPLLLGTWSNAGDTIATVRAIFVDLQHRGISSLSISGIGLTGSARYQVKTVLASIYPALADRILLLVENYAHARGSLHHVKQEIERLKGLGVGPLNEEFCLLIDVGGEDTKVSSIVLGCDELYDNAMNAKCSAGTGSLFDSLIALFHLPDVGFASGLAMEAAQSFTLNATCAVFLLDHARKLQAEGGRVEEILASACWAIVENMARSLWSQIDLPKNCVVLLHGQPMLSDPLPLAITQRLQEQTGAAAYGLIPPAPGHRAAIGLIRSLVAEGPVSSVTIDLQAFISSEYQKKIVPCLGAVCGDSQARCHRSQLTGTAHDEVSYRFLLGGCSAVNERHAATGAGKGLHADTCKEIWQFIQGQLPFSSAPDRLVIPRSFAVSEWASFFAALFVPLGIPVHVDEVTAQDILAAQPHFQIDTCAPHLGVVGQILRLARQPHGVILAPQIEFLPVSGRSLGRTCTINQGGFAVARAIAKDENPGANVHLFHLELKSRDAETIALKLYPRLLPVYQQYRQQPDFQCFCKLVADALLTRKDLLGQAAALASRLASEALASGGQVALVIGREYILNPGVFDSHVGRLLRDQGMAGIPGYLLDVELDPGFDHLYWRNPQLMATLVKAASERRLHTLVRHPGLSDVLRRAETSDTLLPLVQVSTFLCGPDSVAQPLLAELTRQRPFLRIQSDGAIKELAHLENRMNTYVRQLDNDLHRQLEKAQACGFEVRLLDILVHREALNPETDVIYFPTLGDHRQLTAVIRGAGYACFDLYHDDYNLEETIKQGRSVAGDAVCAPLAAVYGDVLRAMDDFSRRRQQGDPQLLGKTRLLMFNNKGLGPCRQGQYVEAHKLFLHQQDSCRDPGEREETVLKFLVGEENRGFNTGFPGWVFLRGVQAVVLQGVLHQLLADGASRCAGYEDYQAFMADYRILSDELRQRLETRLAPGAFGQFLVKHCGSVPLLGWGVKFFAYRLHCSVLGRPLRQFKGRWCRRPLPKSPARIHIDGETYMRVAQFEAIHQALLAQLGFRQFTLTHTPVWSFLEYKLAGMLMRGRESIRESREALRHPLTPKRRNTIRTFLRKKQRRQVGLKATHLLLRQFLAGPLYRAAGLALPEAMPDLLKQAAEVIPTRRPGGELLPYVGEVLAKLRQGYDLILNVAPEGCMVSSMGEAITPGILQAVPGAQGKVQPLFSQHGDLDSEQLTLALLKALGPERLYRAAVPGR